MILFLTSWVGLSLLFGVVWAIAASKGVAIVVDADTRASDLEVPVPTVPVTTVASPVGQLERVTA